MPGRAYPSCDLLRRPDRWEVLPRRGARETARLRLGPGDAPWSVVLVRPGTPLAGTDGFASLSLADPDAPDLPTGMSRLLPLASGRADGLPSGEEGVERIRQALAAADGPEGRARLAALQALAEAAACALPDGQAWRLHGRRLRDVEGLDLGLPDLALPEGIDDGLFVWTDPADDRGLWPLPWRGAGLGGVRGVAGPASAHRRAALAADAARRLSICAGTAAARRAVEALAAGLRPPG